MAYALKCGLEIDIRVDLKEVINMGEELSTNQYGVYTGDKKIDFDKLLSLSAPASAVTDEVKKGFKDFVINVSCTLCKLWILIRKWLDRVKQYFKIHGIYNNHQPRKFRWKQTYKAIRLSSK